MPRCPPRWAQAPRPGVATAIHPGRAFLVDSVEQAIPLRGAGATVGASQLPIDDNTRIAPGTVTLAHNCGISVQGELGYVAGVEGDDAEKLPSGVVFTSPGESKRFVAETGFYCLAVSIDTLHGGW